MTIEYVMSDDGKSILADEKGLPIVVDDKGEQFGLDGVHLYTQIPTLQGEAKKYRQSLAETKKTLEQFEGITDPAEARKALETVAGLAAGDLTKKENLEAIKKDIEGAWKGKLDAAEARYNEMINGKDNVIQTLQTDLFDTMVTSQFSKSKLFAGEDRLSHLTPEIAASYFGKSFKVEKDDFGRNVVIGYTKDTPIYSKERPGEYASFDEAILKVVEISGQKIMKDSGGSGTRRGDGNYNEPTIKRGDNQAIINNLADVASGKIRVV